MKIMNEVFLSFETRDEYAIAVEIWKDSMDELIDTIRYNKSRIPDFARDVAKPVVNSEYSQHFQMDSLLCLVNSQRRAIYLAKYATQMLKIRAKMKKLAGQQMEQRMTQEKELVTI